MSKPRLVVVGNGMAGTRTLEELLRIAPDAYQIDVFGAEPHGNYNRIMLSPVLAGEKTFAEIITHPRSWYTEHGITLHAGDSVVNINRARREVSSASGTVIKYDRLLIATGSKPFVIPVPGHTLPGVIAFRDIGDVQDMLQAARHVKKAVVIGGGLLGLEAANGLKRQGMEVTVVHVSDALLNQQLDRPAADLLRTALEQRGLHFLMNAHTAEIVGPDKVTAIRFKDGTEIAADIVVMAVGIRPNVDLARASGLMVERAIVCNDTLQTLSDPRVYGVGECVQHRQQTYGLVAPLWEQANVCATHLAGFGIGAYKGSITATKLKVTGIDVFSAGDFIGGEGTEDIVLKDPRRGIYKRLVLQRNKIKGAVLYGDVKDGGWYFELIQSGTDITPFRSKLLFGKAFCVQPA